MLYIKANTYYTNIYPNLLPKSFDGKLWDAAQAQHEAGIGGDVAPLFLTQDLGSNIAMDMIHICHCWAL